MVQPSAMTQAIWFLRFSLRIRELSPFGRANHLVEWIMNGARQNALAQDCANPEIEAEAAIRIDRAANAARAELCAVVEHS